MTTKTIPHHAMQCMEIWGGNHATDHCVTTPGLEMWISSRPYCGAVGGGDVHYVSLCGGGSITRILLADVSGHGAAVAEMARALRDLMRRNINRKSAAQMMQALNRRFAELAQLQRFATAVVATYLTKGDRLTICNAGHPRPLLFRAATTEWSVVDEVVEPAAPLAGLPLGIDDATAYTPIELALDRGDMALLYTDALTEAENPAGTMLGEAGLLEMVRGLDRTDPGDLGAALLDALEAYRGGGPSSDDQSMVVLHHTAGHPRRLSMRQTLDVYAKLLHLKRV